MTLSDKGYSGSNINRPGFQDMLADIRSGLVTRVIVYRLDRMSRSLMDFANLIEFLDKHQASFVSTQEKFDTSTPIGRAMLSITMVFAQLERETIQARIKDNYYSRGEKGMYLGGPPSLGFDKTESLRDGAKLKYLIPNESIDIPIQMFAWYDRELVSLGEIARRLNQRKVYGAKGKPWDSSRVCMVLRNPAYVRADIQVYMYYRDRGCKTPNDTSQYIGVNGCYLYGKRQGNTRKYTSLENHTLSIAPHEGVVDADRFLRCQHRLDKNMQVDNSAWGKNTWLTGMAKCAHCGRAAVAKSANYGKYYYFYCSGRNSEECEENANLGRVDQIEAIMEKKLFQVIEKYKNLRLEESENKNWEANHLLAEIQGYKDKISKLIDMAITSEDTTAGYLNTRIKELDGRIKQAEADYEALTAGQSSTLSGSLTSIREQWPDLTKPQKNEIASFFVDRLEVSKGKLSIIWRYSF